MVLNDELCVSVSEKLIKKACTSISPDVLSIMKIGKSKERTESAKNMLEAMIENAELANQLNKPLCQSPGFPTIYISFGKNATLGNLINILSEKMVDLTHEGYMRPSMVHPITRKNSGDNSGPGVPNFEYNYFSDQEYIEIILSFKGCGAELGNRTKIFTAKQIGSDGKGLKQFLLESVINAGGIPCPPIGLGVGIGGQLDIAAKLSRKAISVRRWDDENEDPYLASLEAEMIDKVNKLGIGPAGIGGMTTALAVKIEMAYTHTAIAPVAVNFHCWAARRAGVQIYEDGSVNDLFGR